MARVLCELPFASSLINGVAFTRSDAGSVSEEISDKVAAAFLAIPGYKLVEEKPAAPASSSTNGTEGSGEAAANQTAKPVKRRAN